VPTWINLDSERSATVKVELADKSTKLPEEKIFARNDKASDTARRLGISVTVLRKDGPEVLSDLGGKAVAIPQAEQSTSAKGYLADRIFVSIYVSSLHR
jgi:hypothetical protein